MTERHRARLSVAVAMSRASTPLGRAVVRSEWRTQRAYARHLRVSTSALSAWSRGTRTPPESIVSRVLAELSLRLG